MSGELFPDIKSVTCKKRHRIARHRLLGNNNHTVLRVSPLSYFDHPEQFINGVYDLWFEQKQKTKKLLNISHF